jgi:hypothetical protein
MIRSQHAGRFLIPNPDSFEALDLRAFQVVDL